jgi:hypothetical protein
LALVEFANPAEGLRQRTYSEVGKRASRAALLGFLDPEVRAASRAMR